MKKLMVVSFIVFAFIIVGCSTKPPSFINSTDLSGVDFSKPLKKGESCETMVLIFGPFGDSSIIDAVKNAGISKIEVVEYEMRNKFIIQEKCTIVYGH